MSELLFEIGCEEMPARFVKPAMDDLLALAQKQMGAAKLLEEGAVFAAHGAPRRLALVVKGLLDRQPDQEEEALGPPVAAAKDKDGNPSKAAQGFAKSQGVEVGDLARFDTPKGPRLGVVKKTAGRPTAEVLAELLPGLAGAIPFPKTMRWGSLDFRYARPIHWVVAILDGQVVDFELANIKSGRATRGHRFMAPGQIELSGAADYLPKLEEAFVFADREKRASLTRQEVEAAAAGSGGALVPDPGLLQEVTDLVEQPVACLGSFDAEFLEVPRAVIISAMREHQRYFAIEDGAGKLLPNFIAVNNTRPRDLAVVAAGHGKVLRARLADARFFLTEDLKQPLIGYLDKLKDVTYHAKLGSSHQKVERFSALAVKIAQDLAPALTGKVERAARLAKCDLVTEMVGEFPTLQGVVGAEYATRAGEDPEVAAAIAEHYMPTGSGGELPSGMVGAIVGLADRLDTICGMFGIGQQPTGAADPYALRRAAIAVLRIINEKGLSLSLYKYIDLALAGLGDKLAEPADQVAQAVRDFCKVRLAGLLSEQGVPGDVAEAVLAAGFDDVTAACQKALALAKVKDSEDFAPLAAGMKRVMNILRKEAAQAPSEPPAEDLLEAGAEKLLFQAFGRLARAAEESFAAGDYDGFLRELSGLKDPIDRFFDDVMVMVDDEAVRRNRLALLNQISRMFGQLAEFTHLQLAK